MLMIARARSARARLVRPLPDDGASGWLWALSVTAFAGVLRFWDLGTPKAFMFDETYYAKDAFALLKYGVEQNYVQKPGKDTFANEQILAGNFDNLFAGSPSYVVHPPAGKWIIALGEWLFGMNPFGWRFAVAVAGTLSVLMLARIGRRLFGSTLLGCVAGLLLAVDGLHYVHSRVALLDPLLMFWALAAFGALLIDRDRTRARLAAVVDRIHETGSTIGEFGPSMGWRPWRLTAGVFLGMACATKWSGLWFLAFLGLLTVLWDVGARRSAGVRRPWLGALLRDAAPAFGSLVIVAAGVYLASWTGWFLGGDDAYHRNWAQQNPSDAPIPDALRSLWHYHREAWNFHTDLETFHPYRSNPWGWLLLARPVSYFYEAPRMGELGCDVDQCSQAVTALGTPAIWWASILALPVVIYLAVGRRDWRAVAISAAVAAGYLPWFFFQSRTVFSFYSVVFVPYLVLAITMCLGLLLGPRPRAGPGPGRRSGTAYGRAWRRQWGAGVVGGYVALAMLNFAWLLPVLSAQVIPYAEWAARMWFKSWI